jgi:hypothetical protein
MTSLLILFAACSAEPALDEPAPLTAQSLPVLTQHNDNGRTGAKLDEVLLDTTNVNPKQFGRLFGLAVDGQLYAQPLYLPSVTIAGATREVVYVATQHNSVYAFDAARAAAPLWRVNLGPPASSADLQCSNIKPEIGITGTPVINQANGILFVVAKTEPSRRVYQYRLHALDLSTGAERLGGPIDIRGTVRGSGYDSAGGVVTFSAASHLNRPGLLIANGVLYVVFGSHCDDDPYHGWVFGYDASTLQLRTLFNATPDGERGGIWHSGTGVAADAAGDVYLATGNGTFDARSGRDFGDTVVRLRGSTVIDWFTPHNQAQLDAIDSDLGSGGVLLLPNTNLLVAGGKEGVLYLIDRNSMGHFNASGDSQIVQSFKATLENIRSTPIYWNGPNGPLVYLSSQYQRINAYALVNGRLTTTPVARSAVSIPKPGAFLSISANGSTRRSGVLWALTPTVSAADDAVPGTLRAFDASAIATELWNSDMNRARDALGDYAKFCAPTIANGRVYAATRSGLLQVYGLLGGAARDAGAPPLDASLGPRDGAAAQELFFDAFERDDAFDLGPAWTIVRGAWLTRRGRGESNLHGGDRAAVSGVRCADCRVEARVLGFAVPETAIYLRSPAIASTDRYEVNLAGDGTIQLRRFRGGAPVILASAPSRIQPLNAVYGRLSLSAVGSGPVHLVVAVDGTTLITVDDASAAAITGAGFAGMWTTNAGVWFDDFAIWSEN